VPATVDLKDTEVKKYFLFPRGLPGLEGEKRYCVEAIPGNPFFVMLQPAESGPGLILVDPFPFFPGYCFELEEGDRRELQVEKEEDLVVYTTVTIEGRQLYTNLAAPVVFNAVKRLAKQIILPERSDQLRVPLGPPGPPERDGGAKPGKES